VVAEVVEHRPGLDARAAVLGVDLETAFRYLEKSITTATLQHCPARLVPPPRARMGTPCSRQTATAWTTSSIERGTTTPSGVCR